MWMRPLATEDIGQSSQVITVSPWVVQIAFFLSCMDQLGIEKNDLFSVARAALMGTET